MEPPWRCLSTGLAAAVALSSLVMLSGCGRDEIKVYKVAKESPDAMAAAHAAHGRGQMPPGHPDISAATPKIQYALPSGWEERPASAMRSASFSIPGKDGQAADVSVIPLPTTGQEVELVNMWRAQMQLPSVGESEAANLAQAATIGGETGRLFEMASEGPILDDKLHGRMLVAVLTRGATSWFFKMAGEDSQVTEQKPAFVEFLKSVSFEAPTPATPATTASSATAAATGGSDGKPAWTVPEGWQEIPGGQFLVAKFVVTGEGNARAEINVSMSSGDGGGLVPNVNRWRAQLGLSQVPGAEISSSVKKVQAGGNELSYVELSGTDLNTGRPALVLGAMVPRPGQTWFYKIAGDRQLVEAERAKFTTFAETVRY
ncbi:MAG: hypothetical protein KIS67_10705 [Verrucomicrobiae bacterium]|nr:hypothetical protein [Verrucomicrobiae bacterium]